MGWHVVGPLQRVLVFWPVAWDQMVEDGFHIYPNIRVCIFVDAQSATRMLAEYIDDTRLRQLGHLSPNGTRET